MTDHAAAKQVLAMCVAGVATATAGVAISMPVTLKDAFGNQVAQAGDVSKLLSVTAQAQAASTADAWQRKLLGTTATYRTNVVQLGAGAMSAGFRANITGTFDVRLHYRSSSCACANQTGKSEATSCITGHSRLS